MEKVLALIENYGYLVVLFGVMLESAGVPVPGETILLAAGVLAQRGHLDVGDAIAFGILGAVAGDQIGYWAGREGGRPFVLRWGRYVGITPERLARAEAFFSRHGGKAVFLARFVAGLRVFGALVAGLSRMRWRTFAFYNALGAAVWATAVVMAGFLLGGSLGLAERWLGRATLLLAALVAVAAAFYLAYRWVAGNRGRLAGYGNDALDYPPVARARDRYDAQLRWLLRRLTPGQYLGLHLTLGLAASAGCLWLFGGLAEDVVTRDPLVRFDGAVAGYLHSAATPALTAFFLAVTAFGSVEALAILGLLVAAALARKRLWISLVTWLAAVGGGAVLNQILKALFERPRPFFDHPLLVESSYSFPSGHAMGSLVAYGMLAYFAVLVLGSWRRRVAAVFAATLLILLIGLSRMYLGVHYFSDVAAGYAAGGLWLSALITASETVRRARSRRPEGRPCRNGSVPTACLTVPNSTFGTGKVGMAMGRKGKGGGERAGDRITGKLTETAGMMSGDRSLEAEGRTVARSAERTTYTVTARDGGSWEVRTEGASRATSVHDSKEEAVSRAKKLAGDRKPSQLLVYKQDGTVQTEQTYG